MCVRRAVVVRRVVVPAGMSARDRLLGDCVTG